MKRVLITGAGSYIGTSVSAYLAAWPEAYTVDTLDMQDPHWQDTSFAGYDCVLHVAGIAHADSGRISPERKELYYRVNTLLAQQTAAHARACGVGQFIFMSSAIVYGASSPVGGRKHITRDTPLAPANCYGESKLRAEEALHALEDAHFRVVILRPPMIYGKGSRGNYPALSRLAQRLPFFPHVENERSMLYIENLCEFIRLMIENEERGTFFPQNATYSCTSDLVQMIAQAHGHRVHLVRGMTPVLRLLRHFSGAVDRAFGSLTYDRAMSEYREEYARVDLPTSIRRTEEP